MMIKLTEFHTEKALYIDLGVARNPASVVPVKIGDATATSFTTRKNVQYHVTETPDEIINIIEEAEAKLLQEGA